MPHAHRWILMTPPKTGTLQSSCLYFLGVLPSPKPAYHPLVAVGCLFGNAVRKDQNGLQRQAAAPDARHWQGLEVRTRKTKEAYDSFHKERNLKKDTKYYDPYYYWDPKMVGIFGKPPNGKENGNCNRTSHVNPKPL